MRRSAASTAGRAHRLRLLNDGAFFEAFERAVASARRRISVETYILASDETGWRVAADLVEAARRGVEVRLCYDGVGSLELDPNLLRYLHGAGVRTAAYRPLSLSRRTWPWSRRNHRKSLIVDGWLGIVGGMNIAADYDAVERGGAGWRDTSIEVAGPAVLELEESFAEVWRRAGGERFQPSALVPDPGPTPEERDAPEVRFTHNFLRRQRAEIHRSYLRRIRAARTRIRIVNAYFVPDRRLRAEITGAARRGVDVEIITAGNTDVPLARLASRSYYPVLLKAGVKLYEWNERVLHAKTAVIDGAWSTVGSSNLDYFSSFRNLEVNAVVSSSSFGEQMERQFAEDRDRSTAVTMAWWKTRPAAERLFDFCFRQLARGY